MNRAEKNFEINFSTETHHYNGNIQVMSSARVDGGPRVRIHIILRSYDLTRPKKKFLPSLTKKEPSYKEIGKFSTIEIGEPVEITRGNDSHQKIAELLENSNIQFHPIIFELEINPLLEKIKNQYEVPRPTYAYP